MRDTYYIIQYRTFPTGKWKNMAGKTDDIEKAFDSCDKLNEDSLKKGLKVEYRVAKAYYQLRHRTVHRKGKELKQCPFCGSKAWIQHFPGTDTYEARCEDCGIGTWPQLTRQDAVDKWNLRGGRMKK